MTAEFDDETEAEYFLTTEGADIEIGEEHNMTAPKLPLRDDGGVDYNKLHDWLDCRLPGLMANLETEIKEFAARAAFHAIAATLERCAKWHIEEAVRYEAYAEEAGEGYAELARVHAKAAAAIRAMKP